MTYRNSLFTFVFTFIFYSFCLAQNVNLQYYLPNIEYDQSITSPEEFLGFQIGEWHVSHERLADYMQLLAKESDRVEIENYGYTYENRPLQLLHISLPENLKNKNNIRAQHRLLSESNEAHVLNVDSMPIIMYQGYGIHGNESSGSNAAILVAYYLAAGQGKEVNDLLEHAYILLDPCYNPDGFQRFSSWVNRNKSKNLVSDPSDIEFSEPWPGGRTNHYWSDLNRDWLLLTHVETKGRVANFQKWRPNILTDHHEMGTNSTFFFQPGVPERTNPNTPQKNQVLTEEIGKFHAQALDKIGAAYFTKERYDDYYYGKGSTYPDIQGSIGILFEQASSRGHVQESRNGILRFPYTIRNQVITSLSTQKAALSMRKELLNYQHEFYQNAYKDAAKSKIKAYQIEKSANPSKVAEFVDMLLQHGIQVYDDQEPNGSFYVPTQQRQYRLLSTIFESVHSFPSKVFYDVSTWSMPLAYQIGPIELNRFNAQEYIEIKEKPLLPIDFPQFSDRTIAYAFEWNHMHAAQLLTDVMRFGYSVKAIEGEFTVNLIDGTKKSFKTASMIITVDTTNRKGTHLLLADLSREYQVPLFGLTTGLNLEGPSLGTPTSRVMKEVRALMVVGEGINAYDAGDIWFHCDQKMNIALSKIDKDRLRAANLDRYDVIILPDGNYHAFSEKEVEKISDWVSGGGKLICLKRAIRWADQEGIIDVEIVEEVEIETPEEGADNKDYSTDHMIGGAIFETKIDLSNALFYGYEQDELMVFKTGTLALNTKLPVMAPMVYTESCLASGYTSDKNVERIKNSDGIAIFEQGKGKVICAVDNPLFRGYWRGGNKLFENMLYF